MKKILIAFFAVYLSAISFAPAASANVPGTAQTTVQTFGWFGNFWNKVQQGFHSAVEWTQNAANSVIEWGSNAVQSVVDHINQSQSNVGGYLGVNSKR